MISCIVPVYNNQDSILRVLETLLLCPDVDEVIVVDDCSQDNSAKKIKTLIPRVKAIFNKKNLGKGGAVVKGLRSTRGDTILFCDADLTKMKKHHITNLVNEFNTGLYDMVIAARESNKGIKKLPAKISGERIIKRETIEPYLDLIAQSGNGMEQIINFAHKGKRVKIIVSKNIGHPQKYQRETILGCITSYLKESYQMLRTDFMLRKIELARVLKRSGI